jgi:hypothetical protein
LASFARAALKGRFSRLEELSQENPNFLKPGDVAPGVGFVRLPIPVSGC